MANSRTISGADRETQLARASLDLLKNRGWEKLALASVARSAKLPLSDVLSIVPSKSALPALILRALVKETARRYKMDPGSGGPRERLFDATMTFFDTQRHDAVALKKLYRALRYDPTMLLATRGDVLRLSGQLLALGEADVGLSPRLQATVFAGVLIHAVSVWCDDDDEMGKTMAQLDRDLRRADRFLWPKSDRAGVPPASAKAGRGRVRASRDREYGR